MISTLGLVNKLTRTKIGDKDGSLSEIEHLYLLYQRIQPQKAVTLKTPSTFEEAVRIANNQEPVYALYQSLLHQE